MPATWRWRILLGGIAVATAMILGPPEARAALTLVEQTTDPNTTVPTTNAPLTPNLYNGLAPGNGTTNITTNGIMEALGYGTYGVGFTRVDDSSDELWDYLFQSGAIRLQVKFAGDASNFGAFGNPAGVSPYTRLADVAGSGFGATFTNISTAAQQNDAKTITIFNSSPPPGITPVPELFAWGMQDTSVVNTWSSLLGRNSDGLDHMVTFAVGAPGDVLRYVIAFEDRPGPRGGFGGSDRDFNDLVLEVTGFQPFVVPEPSTLAMAGIGLACFAGRSWRRRRQARRSAV